MPISFPMNGGDCAYSYSRNSQIQREVLDGAKELVRDAIIQNLDIKIMLSSSNTFRITDLGCSIGPNTFRSMQHVVQVVKDKYHNQILTNSTNNIPEFQVFFNDHITNDFNTLFQSLPVDRSYYAFGVPGSFHGASNIEVVNAYVAQFAKDMEVFLNARAEEIVPGGMMVLLSPFSGYVRLMKFFGSSLMDLVNEGMLEESLVDSFNLPLYFPSPEDMTKVVERNGCFSIERIELTSLKSKLVDEADAKILMINLRAALEGVLINQFGSKIGKEACERTILKSEEISAWMKANYETTCQLFVVLKRK
ncbi:loganic acid O-methyltransferase-like isoform X2 [Lycium ferocissimum]|uniref:loganic acid O-methyltransferase-like isoform X2 n=1 Tax=Lycium ferocissimum TaxID=112874 RepID=UPI002815C155|nr:loganic acid O-methyltransferase-like isoform X2 [Lycium ferocissimum]